MSSGHSKCKFCGEHHRLGPEWCPALKSSDRSDEAKARDENEQSRGRRKPLGETRMTSRAVLEAGVGSERTKIRKSGGGVEGHAVGGLTAMAGMAATRRLGEIEDQAIHQAGIKSGSPETKPKLPATDLEKAVSVNAEADCHSVGGEPTKSKRGRPRIGEKTDKPWEAAGMSERTWYRRKKAKQ